MTDSPRDQTPAQQRAAAETAARDRLDAGKQALAALREKELAEAEALNLARIRQQTEQMLASQAEALAAAERRAEEVAIERRAADLAAAKAARLRLEKEEIAARATAAKNQALEAATAAAREKFSLLDALEARRQAARQEREIRRRGTEDARGQSGGRWGRRLPSGWKPALAILLLGFAAGVLGGIAYARHSVAGDGVLLTPAAEAESGTDGAEALRLRLDYGLSGGS